MSNDLEIFNDILNLHFRPWKVNHSPQKYQQLLKDLKKDSYQFQPLYNIAFIKPVNAKRKYYHSLITNEAIKFLNELHDEIKTALISQEKTYWVMSTLEKKLKPKFTEIKNLIEKKQYQLSNISINNDDAYIIQFLKYQLIRLYLEVQDYYPEVLEDDALTQQDILSNFFSDPNFEDEIIIPEEKKFAPDRKVPTVPNNAPAKFVQHNHEIRDPEEGVLLYHEIVEKPDALGRVEEILFEENYIDDNLKFKKAKGKQLVIAAIVHITKQRKFFKEKTFHKGKKISVSHLHIQKFISHRYNVNIDQQYRRFKKQQALLTFLDDNLWIKNLPSS